MLLLDFQSVDVPQSFPIGLFGIHFFNYANSFTQEGPEVVRISVGNVALVRLVYCNFLARISFRFLKVACMRCMKNSNTKTNRTSSHRHFRVKHRVKFHFGKMELNFISSIMIIKWFDFTTCNFSSALSRVDVPKGKYSGENMLEVNLSFIDGRLKHPHLEIVNLDYRRRWHRVIVIIPIS